MALIYWNACFGDQPNYALADQAYINPPEEYASGTCRDIYGDADTKFWHTVLATPSWGVGFKFNEPVIISEWIARVPGLYWKPNALKFREYKKGFYELIGSWHTYEPPIKSIKAMGGIGTLRLPPSDDGYRLVTLASGMNASAGIPALVSPNVWNKIRAYGLTEGRLIRLHDGVPWEPMSSSWVKHFWSTKDIPRGCLVIRDPQVIEILDAVAPVLIHPFTVMEYREGKKELFDYVYATADTSEDFRGRLEMFFADYAKANDRHGRYLLAGDIVEPIWDAEYETPADLRSFDATAKSKLAVLDERIHEHMLGGDTIDRVLEALVKPGHTLADLQRISRDIGIEPTFWVTDKLKLVDSAQLLVEEALHESKLEELIEVLAVHDPSVLEDKEV